MSHTVRRTTGSLPDATAGSVRALARAAADIDGVPPLSEQPLLWLTGGGPAVHHLLLGPDEAPTGYAQLDLRDPARATAELVVHPEHRRTGRGGALLDALTTDADHVDVWAHGDLPAARSLAARRGLPVVRELWQMRLDPLTAPAAPMPTPPDVLVRPFVPGRDEGPWLALNAAAFAHHPEQGRLDLGDLTARENEPWFDPAGFLLAESRADGRLLAAGWTKVPPGADGLFFLPYLSGERSPHMDAAARGAWIGLTLSHDRRHLVRALLEGVGFAYRDCLVRMRAEGAEFAELVVVGGGAKSAGWRQMLADQLGLPLVVPQAEEGPAMGGAILASVAAGLQPDVEQAVAAMIRPPARRTEPDPERAAAYARLHERYAAFYPALRGLTG